MNTQDENRAYERYPFREDILIDGTKLCSSTDISEGGLFVSAIQHFEENDVIEVTIPFRGAKIIVKALVKYYQFGIGMGIMFIDLSEQQKAQIKELLASLTGSS